MMDDKTVLNVPAELLAPIIEEQLSSGRSVRFAPKGKSMLPMIREGRDTVTLSAIEGPLKKYDIGFYRRANGQYVLHRIVKIADTVTCVGDNQFILERGLLPSQFIGVVTAFSRGERTYTVKHPPYCIYCRILHLTRPARYFLYRAVAKLKRILKRR